MNKSILFVDDEKAILNSLMRAFMDYEYDVFFAQSGKEALSILENNSIDLVISDMRMPLMDGRTLLKTVKEKYPDTLRMMLSGYADKNEVIKALIDGSAIIYLLKPWNHEELLKSIEGLFETRASLANRKLGAIITDMEKIPHSSGHLQETLSVNRSGGGRKGFSESNRTRSCDQCETASYS